MPKKLLTYSIYFHPKGAENKEPDPEYGSVSLSGRPEEYTFRIKGGVVVWEYHPRPLTSAEKAVIEPDILEAAKTPLCCPL